MHEIQVLRFALQNAESFHSAFRDRKQDGLVRFITMYIWHSDESDEKFGDKACFLGLEGGVDAYMTALRQPLRAAKSPRRRTESLGQNCSRDDALLTVEEGGDVSIIAGSEQPHQPQSILSSCHAGESAFPSPRSHLQALPAQRRCPFCILFSSPRSAPRDTRTLQYRELDTDTNLRASTFQLSPQSLTPYHVLWISRRINGEIRGCSPLHWCGHIQSSSL